MSRTIFARKAARVIGLFAAALGILASLAAVARGSSGNPFEPPTLPPEVLALFLGYGLASVLGAYGAWLAPTNPRRATRFLFAAPIIVSLLFAVPNLFVVSSAFRGGWMAVSLFTGFVVRDSSSILFLAAAILSVVGIEESDGDEHAPPAPAVGPASGGGRD